MPRRPQTGSRFDSPLTRWIAVILLLILAAIVGLSFFNQAGAMGIILDEYILAFLFGNMRYAVPAVILIIAYALMRDLEYVYRPSHLFGALLFLATASSFFHLGFSANDMWREALSGHGGGAFGLLAWPLKTYVGDIGSLIILFGLFIVSLILLLNKAILYLFQIPKILALQMGAFGRTIASKTSGAMGAMTGGGKIYGNEGEDQNGDEPEGASAHRFSAKRLDESDEEDADENGTPAADLAATQPAATAWTKKVVIKDLPPRTLLSDKRGKPTSGDIKSNSEIIQNTLREFGIDVDMGDIRVGPTVTQYSLKPNKGVKLSRITGLSNDLALALAAHPIRIEAPIPGKSLVGIEVPNQKTALVSIKELIDSKEFASRPHSLMLALGKDVAGKVWLADLPRMPHLLIAGTTGSGKTVCVNTVILSLLYQNTAETLRFIMVDPKRVELTLYNGIPHLLTPVITNVQKTVNALKWTIGEMERRFETLEKGGSRDITSYNQRNPNNKMPHIVFVIDELADLMAAAASEVEAGIIRLAQMARAVGIHIIVATQRPSVDIITGLMKANIPARIAFSVASIIDSRTILDTPGAEKLLGRGDMLFLTSELSKPVRLQGAFVSEDELKGVVEYLQCEETPEYDETIVEKGGAGSAPSMFGGTNDDQDPLFAEAKTAVIQAGKASASLLQRRMKIGYARAARILDELEAAGVIGPGEGAKPREILVTANAGCDTMDSGGELNVFKEPDEIIDNEVTTSPDPSEKESTV